MDFNQVKFSKMYLSTTVLLLAVTVLGIRAKDDIEDFDFNNDNSEIMIAQESRQYSNHAKSAIKIIKPNGVTNSHRPQYNIDSEEEYMSLTNRADLNSYFKEESPLKVDNTKTKPKGDLKKDEPKIDESKKDKQYNPSYKLRSKEGTIRDAVLRALERKDHIGKFAQIVPIIRSMSGSQRGALASLVASQVTTPMDRKPLNLAQVRSMFGNNNTTTELMLPILLDTANLIRRANKHGKQTREVKPQIIPQISRRSDTDIDDDPFETYEDDKTATTSKTTTTTVKAQNRVRRVRPNKTQNQNKVADNAAVDTNKVNTTENTIDTGDAKDDKNSSRRSLLSSTTESSSFSSSITPSSSASSQKDSKDLTADSTQPSANQTLQESPVAEQLRASQNRYIGKGNLRRGTFAKPSSSGTRRTTAEPSMTPIIRKRPSAPVARKPQPTTAPDGQCELFTNSLCLHSEDYPTDAIVLSIRRNKAAAGALLADFQEPKDGAVDGVSAAQEAKYTAEHYLESNRRGDTANRDFAGAGEAGFMCPSIVKYARPQRARATSGQWKYIVNTGEHTQTLRLEKCLKPKESCTYLTDNFKSKCVQVYNYHRLLTWDQQNGLHMDIFKVPTCCSCHIEGYSVNFPPLGHRVQETSSESFPEDIPADHGNNAFEAVQPSVQRPKVVKNPPPFLMKPLETFPSLSETHNHINSGFPSSKIIDTDFDSSQIPTGPIDSYGSSYFPDSFNQGTSNRIVKRPGRKPGSSNHGTVTLPSYLEPPTPANPSSFSFIKETPSKYKITSSSQYKRGAPRPSRRPIRKKLSGAPDDMVPAGTSIAESFTSANIETLEDFNDDLEEPEHVQQRPTIAPKLQGVSTEAAVVSSTRKAVEQKQQKHEKGGAKEAAGNKRVNYNYHPIIDFFEEGKKEPGEEAMDRDDSLAEYVPSLDSEWTPINHPVSRNTQNNLLSRKKH